MWKLEAEVVPNIPLRGPEHDLFTTHSLWSGEDTCAHLYKMSDMTDEGEGTLKKPSPSKKLQHWHSIRQWTLDTQIAWSTAMLGQKVFLKSSEFGLFWGSSVGSKFGFVGRNQGSRSSVLGGEIRCLDMFVVRNFYLDSGPLWWRSILNSEAFWRILKHCLWCLGCHVHCTINWNKYRHN